MMSVVYPRRIYLTSSFVLDWWDFTLHKSNSSMRQCTQYNFQVLFCFLVKCFVIQIFNINYPKPLSKAINTCRQILIYRQNVIMDVLTMWSNEYWAQDAILILTTNIFTVFKMLNRQAKQFWFMTLVFNIQAFITF